MLAIGLILTFKTYLSMRKVLLLFSICALISNNALSLETDDCFTISTAELTPNGDYVLLTVGLQGSRLYTAYNLDITLPPGVDVYYSKGNPAVSMDKNRGIYPFDEDIFDGTKTFTHTLSCSYGVQGERVLRVLSKQHKKALIINKLI